MIKQKKKVDILLVGSYPPPHGGQSVHIEQLFTNLKNDGFEVDVLNTGVNKNIEGVVNIRSSRELLKKILLHYEFCILHLHVSGIDDFGKIVPVFISTYIRKFSWIVTIHSGNLEAKVKGMKKHLKKFTALILSRVNQLICVNRTIEKVISQFGNKNNITVIPAFNIKFKEQQLSQEIRDFLSTHHPLISCTGFYEPIYGFDLAIEAVSKLKETYRDIGLIIMGDKGNSGEYEAHISKNELGESILMCGNVSNDECLSIMRESTLFLRPTLYDGDAISVREALALRIPVVASKTEFRPAGTATFEIGKLDDMVATIMNSIDAGWDSDRMI
jgi:glycogen(starch) synthase